jgi:hypothetical protein
MITVNTERELEFTQEPNDRLSPWLSLEYNDDNSITVGTGLPYEDRDRYFNAHDATFNLSLEEAELFHSRLGEFIEKVKDND